ncbi:hypothetical protein HC928_09055 [bacterium]|nr:hypothetical protein [bacterium]
MNLKNTIQISLKAAEEAIANGEFADAIALYQQVMEYQSIEHLPIDDALFWKLGLAHLLHGNEAMAQEIWFGAIADLPADEALNRLADLQQLLLETGEQQLRQHRFEAAELAYRQSLELDESAVALADLGRAIANKDAMRKR